MNLEDISAPRCFEIERRLQERLDIPVFHDDQHGTAIVTLAALRNAARLTGRELGELRAVISGAGAAGVAIAKILVEAGIGDVAVADRKGVVSRGAGGPQPRSSASWPRITNKAGLTGSLEDGAGRRRRLHRRLRRHGGRGGRGLDGEGRVRLRDGQPEPRGAPGGRAQVRGGRRDRAVSDFPNQINNVLAFPGIFAGALQVRASRITEGMKIAAAEALAGVVGTICARTT